MYRGPFLQWKTLKDYNYNQVEKAARGEMICFLSQQVFSSEPSFITERASMKPVLGSAACWLVVDLRRMIKLSLLFRRPMVW